MRKAKYLLLVSVLFIIGFIGWTAAVCYLDVQPIGVNGSNVGLSGINAYFHNVIGVNIFMYTLTDWLGLIPIMLCLAFAFAGMMQLVKRKSFLKVDADILILGAFYLVTIMTFLFFEEVVINYRPVLIEGVAESSYPSSTTMLSLCVTLTSMHQFYHRIQSVKLRNTTIGLSGSFGVFMVIVRLISGVHWFSDIIGGILLSCSLFAVYLTAIELSLRREQKQSKS